MKKLTRTKLDVATKKLSDSNKTIAYLGLVAPQGTLNTDDTNKRTYNTEIETLTIIGLTESVCEQPLLQSDHKGRIHSKFVHIFVNTQNWKKITIINR